MNWTKVDKALAEAVISIEDASLPGSRLAESGPYVIPGAVLLVAQGGDVKYYKAFGCRSLLPEVTEMRPDLVFDVASLTKAIVSTTLAMKFVERGVLDLESSLSRLMQTLGSLGKEKINLRHLLNHSSGYPAYIPFYKKIEQADRSSHTGILGTRAAFEMVCNDIYRCPLDNLPGKVANYSDIGFILLAHVLEVVNGGKKLEQLAVQEIFTPLMLRNSGFVDLSILKSRGVRPVTEMIVPSNNCAWRKKILLGEVQDENAWAIGGIAGHAGLFTNAEDIHVFAREMIECFHGRGSLVAKEIVREFWKRDEKVPDSSWALGWDTPSPQGSSSGSLMGPNAVGHLGYTGCSLWIEPEREVEIILLTNRVHPQKEHKGIKGFRPVIHDLVLQALAK